MRLLPALTALLLGACSLWPAAPVPEASAELAEQARRELDAWAFRARLRTPEQRAGLRWSQDGEVYDLLLSGPFGIGGVRVSGTPQRAEINDGKETLTSTAPAFDIYRQTGIWVPIEALSWWVRGLPAPGVAAELARGEDGHLREIRQAGWQVALADYRGVAGYTLPHDIRLSQQDWQMLLEVQDWTLD